MATETAKNNSEPASKKAKLDDDGNASKDYEAETQKALDEIGTHALVHWPIL